MVCERKALTFPPPRYFLAQFLERGLTPEATPAEREANAVAGRQQDQREAIRNAAGRARMALARSLRLREEARAREAAAVAGVAEGAAPATLVRSH